MTRQSKIHTPANRRMAALLKEAFEASPMTREELADASGIPDGTLAKMFSDRALISAAQLIDLCDALGADPAFVLNQARIARDEAE
jgi:transcriptional regulator with XRE-family HTH domain